MKKHKKKGVIDRSSETGKFVTKEFTKQNPATTEEETLPPVSEANQKGEQGEGKPDGA